MIVISDDFFFVVFRFNGYFKRDRYRYMYGDTFIMVSSDFDIISFFDLEDDSRFFIVIDIINRFFFRYGR